MFVDKVTVSISAGNGGDGYVSFRTEKYVDNGGPDGGNGGRGANIIAVATYDQNTLAKFRYDKKIFGKDGDGGFRRNQAGRGAPDVEVPLPVGTVITDEDGVVRADLTEDGQRVIIAKGGKGGFGNAHFTSSTRQAPKFAEKGEKGEAYNAVLELKMIADVGVIGLPNAGKSTFLAATTNAKPEIANYAFTTLTPNLGVIDIDKKHSLLIADIPGLIEGASEGRGLGDEFLRHVERTAVLLHCIDAYCDDVQSAYTTIRKELKQYSASLEKKPECIALTKIEGLDKEIIDMQIQELKKVAKKIPIFAISSQAHIGTTELVRELKKIVDAQKVVSDKNESEQKVIIAPDFSEESWRLEKVDDGVFRVKGRKIERFFMRTDTENPEAITRLKQIIKKMGIYHQLKRQSGDTAILYIGSQSEYGVEYIF